MGKQSKKKAERRSDGIDLADRAVASPSEHDEIEKEIENLTPEEREMFVRALGLVIKKRRWMLIGYLGALVAVVLGMMFAFYMYGTREKGEFIGWVFLVPPALAAAVLFGTGRYVKRIK